MMQNTYLLPVMDSISVAWGKTYGAKKTFWASFGILFLIGLVLGAISGLTQNSSPFLSGIISIISEIIIFLIQTSIIYIGIQRAMDLPIRYQMMFYTFQTSVALRAIGVLILKTLILLIPTVILLILPSVFLMPGTLTSGLLKLILALIYLIGFIVVIFLSIRMMLGIGFVLNKGANPWQAIKLSFQATESNVFRIIGVMILQLLIILISSIPLGIGLIWSLPFVFILYGVVYKNLLANIRAA